MRFYKVALMAAAASMLAVSSASAQDAREMSCSELWYARNAIYAEAGYCFKTDRAISVFGRRCHPPYGELRGWERRRVEEIQYWEARKGCRD
jgi:hypothetical protein